MEWLKNAAPVLSIIAIIVTSVFNIYWSKAYKDAKEAQINQLESQISGSKKIHEDQLLLKDQYIELLKNQIDFYKNISSPEMINTQIFIKTQLEELLEEANELKQKALNESSQSKVKIHDLENSGTMQIDEINQLKIDNSIKDSKISQLSAYLDYFRNKIMNELIPDPTLMVSLFQISASSTDLSSSMEDIDSAKELNSKISAFLSGTHPDSPSNSLDLPNENQ